jgi:ectoine hydroxylase-related dioxygenase (phytanoyl-CoA dioxygenase family)
MTAPSFVLADTAARAAYDEDGVVCLRNVFGPEHLAAIGEAIALDLAAPGPFFRDQTPPGSPAKYLFSYWIWQNNAPMRQVVLESPAGEIAGHLMGARRVTMIMDNWFLREAGASNGAPWHQDEPYFDFTGGRLCAIWIPLEDANAAEGLSFVAGSHRWGKLYVPQNFRDRVAFEGVDARYAPIPDIDASLGAYDVRSWDLTAGDCLVFDLRTLHGATRQTTPLQRTIRRLSLRFADENVRFEPRGPWTEEISNHLIALGQRPGEPLNCPLLPEVWRKD